MTLLNNTSNIPIHIVTQLWGPTYVNLFSVYVLRSLMCEGNLPALNVFKDVTYEIYTTEADKIALENNAYFVNISSQFKSWVSLQFVIITEDIEDSYARMSYCHRMAIKRADDKNAAIIFLQPDVIVGNGSLKFVKDQLVAGKRLVMAPGLRGIREVIEEKLDKYTHENSFENFPNSRDLVKLVVSNLHPISKALLWENKLIHSYCSHLYWIINSTSIYARCAHMHPLMVYPRNKHCGFDHTIDWDYFYRACPNDRDWFVASTSDQVCLLELSNHSKYEGTENWLPATFKTIADFLTVATRKPHLKLLAKPYLFIGSTLNNHDCTLQHAESKKIINKAIRSNKSFFIKIKVWIIRAKIYFITMKSTHLIIKNKLLYLIYCSIYFPLRFLYRLIKAIKNQKYIGHEFSIIPNIIQLKIKIAEMKQSKFILHNKLNFILYFSLYYPAKFLWHRQVIKKPVKGLIYMLKHACKIVLSPIVILMTVFMLLMKRMNF